MGSTAGGLPFPVGTDLVRDGDNAIKALADALQFRMGGYRFAASLVTADPINGGFTWFRVPLGGIPFTAPPLVWVQMITQPSGQWVYTFNPYDVRMTGEVGGFVRENNGVVTGNGATPSAYVMLFGKCN